MNSMPSSFDTVVMATSESARFVRRYAEQQRPNVEQPGCRSRLMTLSDVSWRPSVRAGARFEHDCWNRHLRGSAQTASRQLAQ